MTNTNELADLIESTPDFGWLEDAACADMELDQLDLFFVDAGRMMSRDAAALCAGCPVRTDCLDHALKHGIAGGYFGGVSPTKRRKMTPG